jgi:hypothetical protein
MRSLHICAAQIQKDNKVSEQLRDCCACLGISLVRAMAFGCEFSPVATVLFVRLYRSGSPISRRPHCDERSKQLVEQRI